MPLPPDQEHGATALSAACTTAPKVDEASDDRNKARLAILELANMISVPMALNAAVRLNVADAIWSGGANAPLTANQILSRIVLPAGGGSVASADPENLQRVLRMLSSYGVFDEHLSPSTNASTIERRYSLTEVGKTLVTDGDGLSYGAYVLQHHQEALMRAWPLVHTAVLDPSAEPFTRANVEPAYSYYGKDDEMNELMQRAMAGVSVPFMRAVLGSGYDGFNGVGTLVDVGGSAGDCLKMILQKHSDIKEAINFDLPEVVARAPQIPGITHVGGDMFKSIPHADAIFMKWVITTWTDDEVQQIMKTCYDALPKGGKLIACEPVLPEQSDESHRTRALLEGDIFVMTIYRAKGKHRTEEEYKTLGSPVEESSANDDSGSSSDSSGCNEIPHTESLSDEQLMLVEQRTKFKNSENSLALSIVKDDKNKKRKKISTSLELEVRRSPRFVSDRLEKPAVKDKPLKKKSVAQRSSIKKRSDSQEKKGKEVCLVGAKKSEVVKVQGKNKGKVKVEKTVVVVEEHKLTVTSAKSSLGMLQSRSCPTVFSNCINRLSSFQRDTIIDWGFGALLKCDLKKLPWCLSYWVVENFDWRKCAIRTPSGDEIRLTADSVEKYIGLPKGTTDIVPTNSKGYATVLSLWRSQFMVMQDDVPVLKKKITATDVCNAMLACGEDKKDLFIINFLVLINSTLVESCTNGDVNTKFLKCLADLKVAKKFNWCNYTISKLVLLKKEQKDQHAFRGPLLLLLLAYVDRMVVLGVPEKRKVPAISYWSSDRLKEREDKEARIGSFGLGYVRDELTDAPSSDDSSSKHDSRSPEIDRDDITPFETLQKYIARLANLGSLIAEYVREFFKLVKDAPRELIDNSTFIKINEACEKLLNIRFLSDSQRNSSQSQQPDSQDRFFSDPAVLKCIEEIERAILLKEKFKDGIDKASPSLSPHYMPSPGCSPIMVPSTFPRPSPSLSIPADKFGIPTFSLGFSSPDVPNVDVLAICKEYSNVVHEEQLDLSKDPEVDVEGIDNIQLANSVLDVGLQPEGGNAPLNLPGSVTIHEEVFKSASDDVVCLSNPSNMVETPLTIPDSKGNDHVEDVNQVVETPLTVEDSKGNLHVEDVNQVVESPLTIPNSKENDHVEDVNQVVETPLTIPDYKGNDHSQDVNQEMEVEPTGKAVVLDSDSSVVETIANPSTSLNEVVETPLTVPDSKGNDHSQDVNQEMEVELTAKDLVLDSDSSVVEIISNPSNDQTKEVVILSSQSQDDIMSSKDDVPSQIENDQVRAAMTRNVYKRKSKSVSFSTPMDARPKRSVKLAVVKRSPFKKRSIDVIKHLNDDELRIYSWVNDSESDKKECVFQLNQCVLMREDFQQFKPKTYLLQHLIEAWANLLNLAEEERSSDSLMRFFSSPNLLLFTVIQQTMDFKDRSSYFNNMFMDFMKLIPGLNINQIDLFVFPVHYEAHFFMMCFNVKNPRIDIIDNSDVDVSIKNKYGDIPDDLNELFCELLIQNGLESKASPFKSSKKVKPERLALPWRDGKNKVDCGIYLMRHMETYMGHGLAGWDPEINTHDGEQMARMRTRYMSVLLLSDHNELVGEVQKSIDCFPKDRLFKRRKVSVK